MAPENKQEALTLYDRAKIALQVGARIIRANETKGDPVFPRGPLTTWTDSWGRPLHVSFAGTDIDFYREVGDLWNSSLVMAPCNFVGTLLSEAPPQVGTLDAKNNFEGIVDHPLVTLLEEPNPYHTGDAFWLAFAISWFIDG